MLSLAPVSVKQPRRAKDLALTAARMLPKDNNITIKESLDVYSS